MAPTLETAVLFVAVTCAAAPARARPASQPASAPVPPALVEPAWARRPVADHDEGTDPDDDDLDEDLDEADRSTVRRKKRGPEHAWRGTRLVWGHAIQQVSTSVGAIGPGSDWTQYQQLLSFEPAFWPARGLRLGLRLALAFDLSTSCGERECTVSFGDGSADIDFERLTGPAVLTAVGSGVSPLHLEASYSPRLLTIPGIDVRIIPGLRLTVPLRNDGTTRLLGLAPGLALRRSIELLGPFWLPALDVAYAFRAYKYFYEHDTMQVGPNPSTYGGNASWRIENALELRLQLLAGLHLALAYHHFDEVLHEPCLTVDGDLSDHRMLDWLVVNLGYDVLSWLRVSAGFSILFRNVASGYSYSGVPTSDTTVAHVNLTLPVDRLVGQIRSWAGGE